MLSTLSCSFGKQELNASTSLLRPCNFSNQIKSCFNETQSVNSISKNNNGRMLVNLLFICILLAGSCVQCKESYLLPRRASVNRAEGLNAPCICDGRFYQSCPGGPDCDALAKSRDHQPFKGIPDLLGGDSSQESLGYHDYDHPDHVDDSLNEPKNNKDELDFLRVTPAVGESDLSESDQNGDEETVIRHRKVYVAEKMIDKDPVIHPISLTIPVKVKADQITLLPPPKPLFKMRKYTTYETKPEIEMVPVTTTVIKPVGISKDQFIKDKSFN